jgi:hypothetical protein
MTRAANHTVPEGFIVLVICNAIANLQKPGETDPGPERVTEGMQNMKEKLVFQRQAEQFNAINILSLGYLQAVLRGLVWQPGAILPYGRV